MSAGQHGNAQQNSATWTEPPWSGWIETTGDALLILEAARRGLIPRVTRRLVDSERKMITSGSVFVFDEDESGIKRWTDGFFWSPSRILGNFLLYRETDKRGSVHRGGKETDVNEYDGNKNESQSLSRPKSDPGHPGVDKHRERTLVGSLTNSYKFKPDGLMKKTFSLTIGGVAQHLISYYKIEDVESGRLRPPSSLPELAALEISPEYLDKTHFRNPPKVEMGADGVLRYRGEADDIDNSASLLTGPLTGLPLLTDGRVTETNSNKRAKRFEPYGPSSAPKRPRKNTKSLPPPSDPQQPQQQSQEAASTPIASPTATQHQQAQAQTPPAYSDPNGNASTPTTVATPTTAPYASFGVAPYYQMHGYMQPPPPHVPVYAHQAPYATISPTQPIHPPGHPHTVTTQYTYTSYPPPPAPAPPGPTAATTSSSTPISPSDPSQVAVAAGTPTQVPGYYHPPPHPHPHHAYYPPPPPTHPPSGVGVHPPPPPNSTAHPTHPPQMYAAYPPAHGPPPGVWAHPHPHAHPHAYNGYPPPPPPPPHPQQYSYGVYPHHYAQGGRQQPYGQKHEQQQANESRGEGQGDITEEKPQTKGVVHGDANEGGDGMDTEGEDGVGE